MSGAGDFPRNAREGAYDEAQDGADIIPNPP